MSDNLPVLDQQVLNAMKTDLGGETVAFLLEKLKGEIQSSEGELQAFAAGGDMPGLENKAHGLKSAVRSFGGMRLGDLCRALEEEAKSSANSDVIDVLLAQYKSIAESTIASFQ